MSKSPPRSQAVSAYLFRLGNPYASLQIDDEAVTESDAAYRAELRRLENPYATVQLDGSPEDATETPTSVYVRRLQNPYASLSMTPAEPEAISESSPREGTACKALVPRRHRQRGTSTLSKESFQKTCRQIFRQYVPPLEGSTLRATHQEFISRNEGRSPAVRARIVAQLMRYDLSTVPGLAPQFNREREHLTEEKLQKIESAALAESSATPDEATE